MSRYFIVEMTDEAATKIASKRRPTTTKSGVPFSDAWKMGKEIAGYDEKSPIWGLSRAQIYELKEQLFLDILRATKSRDLATLKAAQEKLSLIDTELEKRKAAREAAYSLLRKKS